MVDKKKERQDEPMVFHFHYEYMQLIQDNTPKDMRVSELVRKGQKLVSIVDEEDEEKCSLAVADNCKLSVGEKNIIALKSGYPEWEIDEDDRCTMSVEPLVKISRDRMEVDMILYPALGGNSFEFQVLLEILREAGVRYGINEKAIEIAIEETEVDGKKQAVSFLVAKGKPVQNGEDAQIRLEVELGSIAGEMNEDGSLDFKERRMFVYVDEGQRIATIIPLTEGIPGKNVLGVTVEPNPGKDITVRVTEDAVYDEEAGVVVAGKGGVVSVVNDCNFKVTSKQTISGDIDYSTGNIYAKNNVDITGDVKPDFVVAVRGDIRVGGNVQSATINSHGNLVVSGGVMGEKTQLNIRGDVDLNFIEQGTVSAGGNIVLRKNAYYSSIAAGGDIQGSGESMIVGGRVVCGGDLRVGSIGSVSAEPALIAVGTDIKRLATYEDLNENALEIEEEILQFQQRHGSSGKKPQKMILLEKELSEIQVKLKKINLIEGSPEESMGQAEFAECYAELIVTGKIAAGTRLRIGNKTKVLEKDLVNQKFFIHEMFKAIVADPL